MKKALVLPVLLALAACAESPEQSFAKAQSEFSAHDYTAARIHLIGALQAKPGNRDMQLLLAKTLLALGDGDGAGTALAQLAGNTAPGGELAELAAEAALLRKAPDVALGLLGAATSVEAERLRALALIQKQDLAGAQQRFEAGLAAGGSARLFADYARYRLLSGDIAGADELAAKAAKADPDGIDSLLIGGLIAVRHGNLQAALDRYARAANLYPASVAALTGMAAVLGDLGRIAEMQKVLDRAAVAAPTDPTVVFLRARNAASRKDWAGVRAAIQPAEAALAPLDPIRQIYGDALLRLGQNQLAVAQLAPIARATPGNREAVRLLAEAQLAGGDAAGAVVTLRPLADQLAARSDELALMAKAAQAMGDPAAATYAARSKRPAPQSLGQDLIDGDAAMRAGNWAGAAQSYDRLLATTDGKNIIVLNNMAYAQLMLANFDKAQEFAGRALKLAPDNPSVLDTAGWAQFRTGRNLAEARKLLRRAAQLAPQNATIRAHLAEAERAPG
jgi:tetratricopeptide (TPR) repeat protein